MGTIIRLVYTVPVPNDLHEASQLLYTLLRDFFAKSSHGEDTWKQAANVALVHLCRPGGLGAQLAPSRRQALGDEFSVFAKTLYYSHDERTLKAFCKNAINALDAKLPRKSENRPMARMTAIIHSELLSGRDSAEVAIRAAARVFSDEQRQKRHTVDVGLSSQDPLRDILSVPKSSQARLPKQDFRALVLNCDRAKKKDDVSLMSLLRQAAPFSSRTIRDALGEELYAKCKPLGFADRFSKIILLEIDNSSTAQELSFRKNELLHKLKKIPGLENISDVRFKS